MALHRHRQGFVAFTREGRIDAYNTRLKFNSGNGKDTFVQDSKISKKNAYLQTMWI